MNAEAILLLIAMYSKLSFGSLFTVLILMTLTLSLIPSSTRAAVSSKTYEKWGPRVDNILVKIYGTYDAEVSAMQAGEVDMIDWPLDKDTYDAISGDANYIVDPLTMYDYYDIDINNNLWPTSNVDFRRAIAYLVNYEQFYTTVLRAYSGTLMNSIIWSEWTKWYNPNAKKYSYSPNTAKSILDAAGFKDWDADGDREYKNDTGTYDLPPLIFYAREDDPLRKSLGDMINQELTANGIPVEYHVAPADTCSTYAYENYDYHMYTAGAGPFNDPQFLYDYYHSKFGVGWLPEAWAPNNVFFTNETYDYWAEKLKSAPDEATAIEACKKCQEIMMDQVPLIPVYHSAGSMAARAKYGHWSGEEQFWDKAWEGIVNSEHPTITTGVNDWWTILNARPKGSLKGGSTLRLGTMSDAIVINPVMQYWYADSIILWPIYDSLARLDPYTGELVPWMAKEWKLETWDFDGNNATKLTFKLYNTIKWHDGVPLNSTDVAFTLKYMYDAVSPLYYSAVEKIDGIDTSTPHIETPDPYTISIYYTDQSIWVLQLAGTMPIIPKHVWETIPPAECEAQGEYVTKGNLTGSGAFVMASHTQDESWLLRANPFYFRQLAGDVDASGRVDILDIFAVAQVFGRNVPPASPIVDQNGDQKIDILDIFAVATNFGRTV